MSTGLKGWDSLRHSGLLLDVRRQQDIAVLGEPDPMHELVEHKLRKRLGAVQSGDAGARREIIPFVLGTICGLDRQGTWQRGTQIPEECGHKTPMGEVAKPQHIWKGGQGGDMSVFIDTNGPLGSGMDRRMTSKALHWMRKSGGHLAVLTNGRHWRLVFAGTDFDAFCEWDSDLWFEGGTLSAQATLLRRLFAPEMWTPEEGGGHSPLLRAIFDSRKGQADLSMIMGEKIRQAVELLVREHTAVLKSDCRDVDHSIIYRAAVRIIMRLVVVLFAEARELLPRDHHLYRDNYGLGGLIEALRNAAHRNPNGLAQTFGAWPRVLSLFRLIYGGSHHEALPLFTYGGDLFAPHSDLKNMEEGFAKALGVFERGCFDNDYEAMSDRTVHEILDLITRTEIKLQQNKNHKKVSAPVDFADLSNDYIGILYEGLLDFELHLASEDEPVIFLGIDNEPALPLSTLVGMDDSSIKILLKSKKSGSEDDDENSTEIEPTETDLGGNIEESAEEEPDDQEVEQKSDEATLTENRAFEWASKAIRVTWPSKSNSKAGVLARKIVKRVVLPGEFYLARWGGTRKGSGTFYTPLGIVAPTIKHTLGSLVSVASADGKLGGGSDRMVGKHKLPEEILSLRIVDPACGSGAFLVAATRFLTDALYDSLHEHQRIQPNGTRSVIRILGIGQKEEASGESIADENIPCLPGDQQFESRLKAILRRYVVEKCIYGVDVDPLAVELCRMSLWIETMDRQLRFNFLDHKIKCGDSLVGAWFDEFQHYPVMAWKNRKAGDEKHKKTSVHYGERQRARKIRDFRAVLKQDMLDLIDRPLFHLDDEIEIVHRKHDEVLAALARIHSMSVRNPMRQAERYRHQIVASEAYCSLKDAMDLWCSCWFWPAEEIDQAPRPTTLHTPPEGALRQSKQMAAERRFFHWELEFPEVFSRDKAGFDAAVGNPPWDTPQPKSQEFFSRIDPLYRTYEKQAALVRQKEYFAADKTVERDWLDYLAGFRSFSNFIAHSYNPFGDPERTDEQDHKFPLGHRTRSPQLHDNWRGRRLRSYGYASSEHPFRYQGNSGRNLYKLFLEQTLHLLHDGGRMGFLVPSGIHSDQGTKELRQIFLDRCRWEWVFSFINTEKIFPSIDSRSKADILVVQKGGERTDIQSAFEHSRLENWAEAEKSAVPYPREQIQQFSPTQNVLVEIHSKSDLETLEKIYRNCVLLGNDRGEWGIKYAREFDMTSASDLFRVKEKWEASGYIPDEYSRWLKGKWCPIGELEVNGKQPSPAPPHFCKLPFARAALPEGIILSRRCDKWIRENDIDSIALPLYQGHMIGSLDFSAKARKSGSGSSTKWEQIPWDAKCIEPHFLMRSDEFYERCEWTSPLEGWLNALKLGMADIGGSTNKRSMMAAPVIDCPCGNKVPTLTPGDRMLIPVLAMLLNSYAYDYVMRARLSGTTMNKFVVDETPLPPLKHLQLPKLQPLAVSASMSDIRFACVWEQLPDKKKAWRHSWAITPHERARVVAMCDAISFSLFGYDLESAHHVMSGCDLPLGNLPTKLTKLRLPSGFWRVDNDKFPELRQSILGLVAFHELQCLISRNCASQTQGIGEFLGQNGGQGWMLPEALRLADYGLGYDNRAREHQPVVSEFGPRFLGWQLNEDVEESWKECRLHARNFLGQRRA